MASQKGLRSYFKTLNIVTNWETYVWWLCSKAKPLGCQVFMVKRLVEINMCTQEMKNLNVLLFSFIRMCLFLLVCLCIMLWVIVLTSQNKTQIHIWSQIYWLKFYFWRPIMSSGHLIENRRVELELWNLESVAYCLR